MLRDLLFRLSDGLPCRVIHQVQGTPYLERYHVASAGQVNVYLHRFVGDDAPGVLHDHPWPLALSLILWGAYREERLEQIHHAVTRWRVLGPGRLNLIRGNDHHRVELVSPEVWTLFVTLGKTKGWGFLTGFGGATIHTPWRTFLGEGGAATHDGAEHGEWRWWLRAPLGRDADGRVEGAVAP
ncbi:MAG TPA: hypothetical protein VEI97_14545 [bacterium]|nr:hypothetical protein [bacterium]